MVYAMYSRSACEARIREREAKKERGNYRPAKSAELEPTEEQRAKIEADGILLRKMIAEYNAGKAA